MALNPAFQQQSTRTLPLAFGYVQGVGDRVLDYTAPDGSLYWLYLLGEGEWDGPEQFSISTSQHLYSAVAVVGNPLLGPAVWAQALHFHSGAYTPAGLPGAATSNSPDQAYDPWFSAFPSVTPLQAFSGIAYYMVAGGLRSCARSTTPFPCRPAPSSCPTWSRRQRPSGVAIHPLPHLRRERQRRQLCLHHQPHLALRRSHAALLKPQQPPVAGLTDAEKACFNWIRSSPTPPATTPSRRTACRSTSAPTSSPPKPPSPPSRSSSCAAAGRSSVSPLAAGSSSSAMIRGRPSSFLAPTTWCPDRSGSASATSRSPPTSSFPNTATCRSPPSPPSRPPSPARRSRPSPTRAAGTPSPPSPSTAPTPSAPSAWSATAVVRTRRSTGSTSPATKTSTATPISSLWTSTSSVCRGTPPVLPPRRRPTGGFVGTQDSRFSQRAPTTVQHRTHQRAVGQQAPGLASQPRLVPIEYDCGNSTYDQTNRLMKFERDRNLGPDTGAGWRAPFEGTVTGFLEAAAGSALFPAQLRSSAYTYAARAPAHPSSLCTADTAAAPSAGPL